MRRWMLIALPAAALAGVLAAGCSPDPDTSATVQSAAQSGVAAARLRGWHGTLTVETNAAGSFPDPGNNQFSEATNTVDFTRTANFTVAAGRAEAILNLRETTHTDSWVDYDAYTMTGTVDGLTSASGVSPEARVNVEIFPNGRYTIDFGSQGIDGTLETRSRTQVTCKPNKDPECKDRVDETEETAPINNLGSAGGGVEGRINSNDPNQLSGSHSENYEHGNEVQGRTVITWSMSR